ncbi:LacI family transcriptional regulator [Desulfovibrio sp. OttesenSCG-928-I05]|nr:LacI family transcriptional regulator [Desulfovibrio sp. OttesenSCG-928-I05]
MASIKDVARLAGVSVMTASRVMNGNGSVSPVSCEKVRAAAIQLDYRPNLTARSLRSKRTRLLGLLVPDIENPTFAALAKYAEEEAEKRGYNVVLGNTWESAGREAEYYDIMRARQTDGILVAPVSNTNGTLFGECPLPVVVLDRSFAAPVSLPSVVVDNGEVGRLAAEHLLEKGHRLFACITGPAHVDVFAERLKGFRQALAAAGHELTMVMHVDVTGQIRHAVAAGEALFASRPQTPLALFCATDIIALGAMKAAAGAGLRVPDDVSVVGVDDIPAGELIFPALTTVRQPIRDMAATAVAMLTGMLEGEDVSRERLFLRPELVPRESTTAFIGE